MLDFVFLFFNNLFDIINQWDKEIYILIQKQWTHAIGDAIFPILRNKLNWIPLYIMIAIYVYKKENKKFIKFLGTSILLIAVADSVCAKILKELFMRIRPCVDGEMTVYFRGIINCSNGYSMPSCHAMNHAALACFWSLSELKRYKWILALWASIIAYSQMYVGVHYFSDVLVGLILGMVLGYFANKLYRRMTI